MLRFKFLHNEWNCFWLIFGMAFLFIIGLQNYYSSFAENGLYFQRWIGDRMMQTLPAVYLKNSPLMNLLYLHKQPPMLDIVRSFFAVLSPSGSSIEVGRFVDQSMYFLGMGLFSLLAALVFRWVSIGTKSKFFGLIAAIIWIPAPAALTMATLLEGTLLSTLIISWMLYQTWQYTQDRGNPYLLGLSAGLAFLTRSVFQWFYFPVFAVVIILLGLKKKDAAIALSILGVIMLVFCAKQYFLFGTISTTTFSGQHKTGVIWHKPSKAELAEYQKFITAKYQYPTQAEKYTTSPLYKNARSYNTEEQWRLNLIHDAIFAERLKKHPIESLQGLYRSFLHNLIVYWQPTSTYTKNHLVGQLSWRKAYDWVFSNTRLVMLLIISFSIWFLLLNKCEKKPLRPISGLLLVLLFVLAVTHMCNRLNWSEADRLKFFLEPTFFVFIFCQFTLLIKWVNISRLHYRWPRSLPFIKIADQIK